MYMIICIGVVVPSLDIRGVVKAVVSTHFFLIQPVSCKNNPDQQKTVCVSDGDGAGISDNLRVTTHQSRVVQNPRWCTPIPVKSILHQSRIWCKPMPVQSRPIKEGAHIARPHR